MKKILAVLLMLAMTAAASMALAAPTVTGDTGYSYHEALDMLMIKQAGSYTVSNWGTKDAPATGRISLTGAGDVSLTLDGVHLAYDGTIIEFSSSENVDVTVKNSTLHRGSTADMSGGRYAIDLRGSAGISLSILDTTITSETDDLGVTVCIYNTSNTEPATLVIERTTIDAANVAVRVDSRSTQKTTVKQSTITGGSVALDLSGSNGSTLEAVDSTITGTSSECIRTPVYLDTSLNVKGCTVSGMKSAISAISSGGGKFSLSVEDSEIISTHKDSTAINLDVKGGIFADVKDSTVTSEGDGIQLQAIGNEGNLSLKGTEVVAKDDGITVSGGAMGTAILNAIDSTVSGGRYVIEYYMFKRCDVSLGANVTLSGGNGLYKYESYDADFYADAEEMLLQVYGGESVEAMEELEPGRIYDEKTLLDRETIETLKAIRTIGSPKPEGAGNAAADLPRTGDASMLGAWIALLGLAGAGMMMRRREA